MKVKWKGHLSSQKSLPGGGPQGCQIGQESYLSQTNKNVDFLPKKDKFKWIDDLTILEIINLVSIGLASYNFRQHVASDIGIDQKFLPSENVQYQNIIEKICMWTKNQKMVRNEEKSKVMKIN